MPWFPPWVMSPIQQLAQNYIQSGLRMGKSANQIQSYLQSKSLGYRRQLLLKDVRYWREAFAKADALKYVNRLAKPSSDLYIQTGWQTRARYETVVSVRLRDRFTGETLEREVTVLHTHLEAGLEVPDRSQNLTRGEIEDAAEEMVAGYPEGDRYDIESIVPVLGWFNPAV